MPLPLGAALLAPAAKAVAFNTIVKTGAALAAKKALTTAGAKAAVLLATTPKIAIATAPNWLKPLISTVVGSGVLTLGTSLLQALLRVLDPSNPKREPTEKPPQEPFEYLSPNGETQRIFLFAGYKSNPTQFKACPGYNGGRNEGERNSFQNTTRIATGIRINTGITTEVWRCGSGGDLRVRKPVCVIEFLQEGEWVKWKNILGWDGVKYSTQYTTEDWVYEGRAYGLKIDGEDVPIVLPEPDPVSAPLPAYLPAYAPPALLPEQLQQLAEQTKPKVYTSSKWQQAPELQPLPEKKPLPTIPAPITPVTAPEISPAPLPNQTQTTTTAGQIVPADGRPVAVTNPADHFLGNAGGRISGRTAGIKLAQIAQEVARVEQKTANISRGVLGSNNLGDLANALRLILELLNATTPGTTYELNSVCECDPDSDENCEEETFTKDIPAKFWGDASIDRLDAIAEMLQPLKTWKQPICKEKPKVRGNWRTIQWISDELFNARQTPLRKTLRYRSEGSQDLSKIVDHWKDFVWESGPVCVINKGLWWGVPQVWAASEAEGKRVIEHAAVEAGISLEKSEWVISGSKDARYGQNGTMRVRIFRNASFMWYGITNRDGSDARPLVQEYLPPIRVERSTKTK